MELLSNVELENLSPSERKDYYIKLREKCLSLKNNQSQIGQGIIKNVYPVLRGYKLELEGTENIPKDSNLLFLSLRYFISSLIAARLLIVSLTIKI